MPNIEEGSTSNEDNNEVQSEITDLERRLVVLGVLKRNHRRGERSTRHVGAAGIAVGVALSAVLTGEAAGGHGVHGVLVAADLLSIDIGVESILESLSFGRKADNVNTQIAHLQSEQAITLTVENQDQNC
jgi:hypothetical protein